MNIHSLYEIGKETIQLTVRHETGSSEAESYCNSQTVQLQLGINGEPLGSVTENISGQTSLLFSSRMDFKTWQNLPRNVR